MNKSSNLDWWNKKHHKYNEKNWINKPSIFAEWVLEYLPNNGLILDIGAGHGQDSRYFAKLGYRVVCTDFSEIAVRYADEKLGEDLSDRIEIMQMDASQELPFEDKSLDVVYSHLGIHFFDFVTTKNYLKKFIEP